MTKKQYREKLLMKLRDLHIFEDRMMFMSPLKQIAKNNRLSTTSIGRIVALQSTRYDFTFNHIRRILGMKPIEFRRKMLNNLNVYLAVESWIKLQICTVEFFIERIYKEDLL